MSAETHVYPVPERAVKNAWVSGMAPTASCATKLNATTRASGPATPES